MLKFLKKNILSVVLTITLILLIAVVAIGAFSVWYVLRPWNSDINYLTGENITIEAFDGIKLTGNKRYADIVTDSWVLIVHSYRSHKSAMSPYERHYHEKGYNTLCVDNRAHGQSEGSYIGMGYLDQFDIEEWVNYILAENPNAKIVLHGLSMGGASCIIYSGRDVLPKNVVAVVNDSGYASAESYLTWKLKHTFGLPSFPIVPIANMATKISAGYWLSDASAFEAVKNSTIPTLFIHCDNDMTVPVADAHLLYNAANCKKDILIISDAGHGEGVIKDADQYWTKVDTFINQNK